MSEPKIQTSHILPPVPSRRFDWVAYFDDNESLVGFGAREREAIEDLKEQIESESSEESESHDP